MNRVLIAVALCCAFTIPAAAETALPQSPEREIMGVAAALSQAEQIILGVPTLVSQNAALKAQNAALQKQIDDMKAASKAEAPPHG